MRKLIAVILVLAIPPVAHAERAAAAGGPVTTREDGVPVYRLESLSPVYTIDKIYKSMQGPMATDRRVLLEDGDSEPELLWMTGYRTVVTKADGGAESPEFMCHSSMDTDAGAYHRVFPTRMALRGNRLFSVDQGTRSVVFPDGFGIPILSSQPVTFVTQVLNHNVVGEQVKVRQRVSIDFVRHRDLAEALVPLVQHGVFGLVLVEGPDGHVGVEPAAVDEARHGPGCSIAREMGDARGYVRDRYGRTFSSFWVVEPGRHVYHTRVTDFLTLPYDTTVHYVAAHLHPFAESIELFDLTTGKTVVKLGARQRERRIGLAEVEHYAGVEGLPLYADHEYDLVTIYDNTSGEPQDAMATMLLYVRVRDLHFIAHGAAAGGPAWRPVVPGPLPAAQP